MQRRDGCPNGREPDDCLGGIGEGASVSSEFHASFESRLLGRRADGSRQEGDKQCSALK